MVNAKETKRKEMVIDHFGKSPLAKDYLSRYRYQATNPNHPEDTGNKV